MKKFKRLFCTILSIAMILSISAGAIDSETISNKPIASEKLDTFIQKFVEIKIKALGANIIVDKIKTLNDFDGNVYKLAECSPTGYFIILPESGRLIEYTTESVSPYKGSDEGLFYVGPTFYYIKSDTKTGEYNHPFKKDEVINAETISLAKEKSAKVFSDYSSNKVENVCNFFKGTLSEESMKESIMAKASPKTTATAKLEPSVKTTASATLEPSIKTTASATYTPPSWVTNSSWFSNLSDGFGYLDWNVCGYNAANLVLKYWDDARSEITLPSWHETIDSTALTYDLIYLGSNLGYGYSTTGLAICGVLNRYVYDYSVGGSSYFALGYYNANVEIDAERPVILFGDLYNPQGGSNIFHAVVAYGYNLNDDPNYITYTCHYGWPGYPSININAGNSTFGSSTRFVP